MKRATVAGIMEGTMPPPDCPGFSAPWPLPRGTVVTLSTGDRAFVMDKAPCRGRVVIGNHYYEVGDEVVFSAHAGQVTSMLPMGMRHVGKAVLAQALAARN